MLCALCLISSAHALEDGAGIVSDAQIWRLEDVAARRIRGPVAGYSLNRTQTWANGLAASRMTAFVASDPARTVGAKMQPFHDWNFLVGTELTRSGDSRFLSSKAMWESFWSRDVESLGLGVGFSTIGSVDNGQTDYLQSFSGNLDVPLDSLSLDVWTMKLRVSPNMNVDVSNGVLHSSLMSELMGQAVLSSRDAAYRSTLNVSVGYSLAPDAQPAGLARVELRISPRL